MMTSAFLVLKHMYSCSWSWAVCIILLVNFHWRCNRVPDGSVKYHITTARPPFPSILICQHLRFLRWSVHGTNPPLWIMMHVSLHDPISGLTTEAWSCKQSSSSFEFIGQCSQGILAFSRICFQYHNLLVELWSKGVLLFFFMIIRRMYTTY